jgi:hypothetical protein
MPDPWTVLIERLSRAADAPPVTWPASQRRIVRCLGNWSESAEYTDDGAPPRNDEGRLLEVLKNGPMSLEGLADATERSIGSVLHRLKQLRRRGCVQPMGIGLWELVLDAQPVERGEGTTAFTEQRLSPWPRIFP